MVYELYLCTGSISFLCRGFSLSPTPWATARLRPVYYHHDVEDGEEVDVGAFLLIFADAVGDGEGSQTAGAVTGGVRE